MNTDLIENESIGFDSKLIDMGDKSYALHIPDDETIIIDIPHEEGQLTLLLRPRVADIGSGTDVDLVVRSESDDVLWSEIILATRDSNWFENVRRLGSDVHERTSDQKTDIAKTADNHYVFQGEEVRLLHGDMYLTLSKSEHSLLVNDEAIAFYRPSTKRDVMRYLPVLKRFMSKQQVSLTFDLMREKSEEGQFFKDKLVALGETFTHMPQTHGQEGKGDDTLAYIHYFQGGADWYITEKDMENQQLQAFGMVDLGYGPEMGYINIEDLQASGIEIDFHFKPTAIGLLKEQDGFAPR
jgi:hypothetical protein